MQSKERKTIAVKVYFTPTEYNEVKSKANEKELTIAKYIRQHYIK